MTKEQLAKMPFWMFASFLFLAALLFVSAFVK